MGGFAEFICIPEDKLALKPAHLSFEEAGSVTVAAITALQGLRDYGRIQAGQILIDGASVASAPSPSRLRKHLERK